MLVMEMFDLAKARRWGRQRSAETTWARAVRVRGLLGPATRVGRLTEARLRRLAVELEEAGLSAGTVNRHLSALSGALECAVEVGALRTKPPLPWRREPRGRTRTLTPAEIDDLCAAAARRDSAMGDLFRFLAETGLRVGEALALAPRDVLGNRAIVRTSKNGEGRTVYLTDRAMRAYGRGWAGLSQSKVNHAWRAAKAALGWTDPELVPHSLRHTCATRLVEAGVSLPVIQAWLGHRTVGATLRYTHVTSDALNNAAKALANA